MKNMFYVLVAAGIAIATNYISSRWFSGELRLNSTFFLLMILSPLVFLTYGFVTTRFGLAVTAGIIDSLMVIGTVAIGVVFLRESLSIAQYIGVGFSILGVVLMTVFSKG
jgi:drug/metabolite transporter (DMT)-like permease